MAQVKPKEKTQEPEPKQKTETPKSGLDSKREQIKGKVKDGVSRLTSFDESLKKRVRNGYEYVKARMHSRNILAYMSDLGLKGFVAALTVSTISLMFMNFGVITTLIFFGATYCIGESALAITDQVSSMVRSVFSKA